MSNHNMKISFTLVASAVLALAGAARADWTNPAVRKFSFANITLRPPQVEPYRFSAEPEDLLHPPRIVTVPMGPASPMAHVDTDEEIAGIDSENPRPGDARPDAEEEEGVNDEPLFSVADPTLSGQDPFLPRIIDRRGGRPMPSVPSAWDKPADVLEGFNGDIDRDHRISDTGAASLPSGSGGAIPSPGALVLGVVGAIASVRRRRIG